MDTNKYLITRVEMCKKFCRNEGFNLKHQLQHYKLTDSMFCISHSTFHKQLHAKSTQAAQLTSLIIKCMMVLGTRSRVILLMIARYEATRERMISTWRSSAGSDLPTSSFDCNTNHFNSSKANTCSFTVRHSKLHCVSKKRQWRSTL